MTDVVLLLPGDGIGPEVVAEARRVIEWFIGHGRLSCEIQTRPIGGASYAAHKSTLTDETLELARNARAIVLGCVGDPDLDYAEPERQPSRALLKLRRELELYINARPVSVLPALENGSPLKPEVIRGVDLVIVRELAGGIYYGQPRGFRTAQNGTREAFNTRSYNTAEIERIAHHAFELARSRRRHVTSVDKAVNLEVDQLWREVVQAVHDRHYADVTLQHMYVDNAAMQLVRNPRQFDVIVVENQYGDILSDCAAVIPGSIGLLPSASHGPLRSSGRRSSLYEPIHGSAPDIANQNKANPIAAIRCVEMMLRESFGQTAEADLLAKAIERVLSDGVRTGDMTAPGASAATTTQMGQAVLNALERTHQAA